MLDELAASNQQGFDLGAFEPGLQYGSNCVIFDASQGLPRDLFRMT